LKLHMMESCTLLTIDVCINYNNIGKCIYMCFVGYITFIWTA